MQLSIVSYLDPTASARIRDLQRKMSEITGSTASLHSWEPHITLGDGIEVTEVEAVKAIDAFKRIAIKHQAFTISLSGFSSLDSRPIGKGEKSTPYVIYADVVINSQLRLLVDAIGAVTHQYSCWYTMPRPYLPHVTLAFRDLEQEGYEKGLAYLSDKNIELAATIDHIALVEKLPEIDTQYARIKLS